jgi:hypothetical protein
VRGITQTRQINELGLYYDGSITCISNGSITGRSRSTNKREQHYNNHSRYSRLYNERRYASAFLIPFSLVSCPRSRIASTSQHGRRHAAVHAFLYIKVPFTPIQSSPQILSNYQISSSACSVLSCSFTSTSLVLSLEPLSTPFSLSFCSVNCHRSGMTAPKAGPADRAAERNYDESVAIYSECGGS